MISNYSYELSDGTFTSIKPETTNNYTIWVYLIAKEGFILYNKYINKVAFSLFCTLGMSGFWEEVPLDKI